MAFPLSAHIYTQTHLSAFFLSWLPPWSWLYHLKLVLECVCITCSGPWSWPSSLRDKHVSLSGPWRAWTTPSGSPGGEEEGAPVCNHICLYSSWRSILKCLCVNLPPDQWSRWRFLCRCHSGGRPSGWGWLSCRLPPWTNRGEGVREMWGREEGRNTERVTHH